MYKRKILNATFALIIVISALVGSTGTAVAVHGGECSEIDEFFWVLSVGLINSDKCDSSHLSQDYQELQEAAENSTETQIYNAGKQAKADQTQYFDLQNNYLLDSGTPAMTKAESAAIAAIDANKSRSEVKQDARNAVQDYYSRMQMNLVDQWGVHIETIGTMEVNQESAGISEMFVESDGGISGSSRDTRIHDTPTEEGSVTLLNGTTYFARGLRLAESDTGNYHTTVWPNTGNVSYTITSGVTLSSKNIVVQAIEGETGYNAVTYYEYKNRWNAIDSKSQQMEDNAAVWADGVYNASQSGGDITNYISPSTLAEKYSTDFNSTGYYGYAVGYAGAQGFAIPNLTTTNLMTIQADGKSFNGLLMSQNPPSNGMWEVGTTYNAQNIVGKQLIATTDGNLYDIQGEFTITSMQDKDGNEVQTTTVRQIEYNVSNADEEYAKLQDTIRQLQLEVNALEPMGSGSSGGDSSNTSGFSLPDWLTMTIVGIPVWLIGIVALAIAYIFMGRR